MNEATNKIAPNDLVYPELSYKLVGLAYKIDSQIGYGQNEKVYCDAFEGLLSEEKLPFKREIYWPIKVDDKVVAKRYFDFLIDDKIIVEMKIDNFRYREVCSQLFGYLKASNIKLGIVIRFTRYGVKIKRIPCFY